MQIASRKAYWKNDRVFQSHVGGGGGGGFQNSLGPPPPPINVTTLHHPTLMKNSDWPRFGTQPCTRLPVTFKSKNNNKQ